MDSAETGKHGAMIALGGTGQPLTPIEGDREAVAKACLYPQSSDPIRLKAAWWTITPAWSAMMMRGREGDYKETDQQITVLEEEMVTRNWQPTGEAIVIDEHGVVIKGKKKLVACIRANTPFVSLVITGVSGDANVLETVGTGRARKLADILKGDGIEPHRSVATALPLLFRLRNGTFDPSDRSRPSDHALVEFYHANPIIADAFTLAVATQKGRIPRLPVMAVTIAMTMRANRELAVEYNSVSSKDGLAAKENRLADRQPETHPARAVNDLFRSSRASNNDLDHRMIDAVGTLLNGYNAYATRITPRSYRYRLADDAGNPLPFPIPHGWVEGETAFQLEREGKRAARLDAFERARESASAIRDFEESEREALGDLHPRANIPEPTGEFSHPLAEEIWLSAFPDGVVPEVTLEMVDQHSGDHMLERNVNNRAIQSTVVDKYARDVDTGDFRSLNGQTIKIAKSDRLLDSQHRLKAVVKAKGRLPFIIVRGLRDDVFEFLDRGRAKSFRHVLEQRGFKNANIVASATRLMWLWDTSRFSKVYGVTPSISELSATLAKYPALQSSLKFASGLRKRLTPSAAAWVEFMLVRENEEKAKDFLYRLSTGEELKRQDPILVLREALITRYLDQGGGEEAATMLPVEQAALVVLAWNAWVAGEKAKVIKWDRDAGFPEISGVPS